MAHIQLLGTGVIIASRGSGSGRSVATDAATDPARGEYGELRVSAREALGTNSHRLTLGDLRLMAGAAQAAPLVRGTDGLVVTHGTDTLEETAFPVDLVHPDAGGPGGPALRQRRRHDLVAAGVVPSGDLDPVQARILAALLLAHDTSAAELPSAFRAHL